MQARLPDINTAIIRYRNAALYAFDRNEYTAAAISLNAINALLPEEYKVEIDDGKYEQAIQEQRFAVCKGCKQEIRYDGVKWYKMLMTGINALLFHTKYESVWDCPECKYLNFAKLTDTKKVTLSRPYYLGVVPECPKRATMGIVDRSTFPQKFRIWFDITLQELESKIGKYRADYMAQQGADEVQIPDEV